jgi:DNA-binding transcriptional LysR family regulator
MVMNIDFNLLRHVVALGEYLHFGKAAKALHISQPALSRSIRKLELRLGQPLFERGTKFIKPTDFGRLFIERAKVLLASVNNFAEQMLESGQETFGRLVIGSGPYPAESVVASAMMQFSKLYPKVEQLIRINSIEELLPDLLAGGGLECIIAELSAIQHLPGLEITPMGSHAIAFVVRAGHPLANSNVSLQKILQYPFIAPSRLVPRAYGPLHAAWNCISPAQRPAFPAFECASLSITKRMLRESDATSILLLSTIAAELERGEMIVLHTEPWMRLNYGFVQRKGFILSNHANEFKQILLKEELALAKREKLLCKRYLGK